MKTEVKVRSLSLCLLAISTFIVPIAGLDMQDGVTEPYGTFADGLLETEIVETVLINSDGTCEVHMMISAISHRLAEIYGLALGFNVSSLMGLGVNYTVSDYTTGGELTFNETAVTVIDPGSTTASGNVPANSSFCNGIHQQQLLWLGINIVEFTNVQMQNVSETGPFLVYLEASGEFLDIENSGTTNRFTIGPQNWEVSCDRSSYILTEIGFIQEMLGNSTEDQYNRAWTTTIKPPTTAPISNYAELYGKLWNVDFGDSSANLHAEIQEASPLDVVLFQNMHVTEANVSKSENELWQHLLCFQIFEIECTSPTPACQASGCLAGIDDFSWSGSLTLLNIQNQGFQVEFDYGAAHVILNGSFSVELSAHVGLQTKWFKLRKFEAYAKLSGSLSVNFTVQSGSYHGSWETDIFDWSGNRSRPYTFWIGPHPVIVIPHFTATAKFSMDVASEMEITCGATAAGWTKGGAGWKKHRGFYHVFDAGMDVSITQPTCNVSGVAITARPSLGFKPSLLFYDVIGPSAEIEPYVEARVWYNGTHWTLDIVAGVCLSIGISFSGWFKKITGLSDWHPAKLFDWVLWTHPDRPSHDVAVASIRSSGQAFVGEIVTFSVDVVNLGQNSESNVNITLCYWNGSAWKLVDTTAISSLPDRHCDTVNMTWDTTGMPAGNYSANATATISDDDADLGNNNKTQLITLDIQDINVTNLTSHALEQQINVTVKNVGTGLAEAVVVQLYYDGNLVGEEWHDHMRIAFNLSSGNPTTLTFHWDEVNHPNASRFLAYAIPLDYEWHTANNRYPRIPGDVDGNGMVNMLDLYRIALHYGSTPGHPRWDPNCDVDGNNMINMLDLYVTAINFGKTFP